VKAKVLFWRARQRGRWKQEALWIAGAIGAGTAIGAAVTRRKKGAAVGAISGGAARLLMRLLS
jgi:hypothetical protein